MRNIGNLRLNIKELVLLKSKPVDYIEDLLLKSYSHKPYLAKMPYDRNTRNPYKMCARYMALDEYEDDLKKTIVDLNQEFSECTERLYETLGYKEILQEDLKEAQEKYAQESTTYLDFSNGDLQEQKQGLADLVKDRLLMDGGVTFHDEGYDQFDLESEEEDWVMNWETAPSYQYFDENWITPLDDCLDFVEETGYCDDAHSKMIDDYIEKLEGLGIDISDVNEDTPHYSDAYRLKTGIDMLRELQANKKSDIQIPQNEEIKNLKDDIKIANEEIENSKKEMRNLKKQVHERNVALYEVANEKQNCADIFSETSGSRENIEDYLSSVDFEQYLNDDRTVKADFLDAQRQVALDNGDPWYE